MLFITKTYTKTSSDEYERRDGSDNVGFRGEGDYERSQRNNKRSYRENDYGNGFEKKEVEVSGGLEPAKTVKADSELLETAVNAEDGI